jgi:hypothetical protein
MSGYENTTTSSLGGGIPGSSKVGFNNTQKDAESALKRKILRKAFKSSTISYVDGSGKHVVGKSMTGPFRASFNAGDLLNRKYQSCGGCNQVGNTNSSILRPKMADSVSNTYCDATTNGVTPRQVPLYSGNSRYVSDSSLFTKFKQLNSINSNYNDKSFGGNDHNGSYTFLRNLR